jgi:hypothetical protein
MEFCVCHAAIRASIVVKTRGKYKRISREQTFASWNKIYSYAQTRNMGIRQPWSTANPIDLDVTTNAT